MSDTQIAHIPDLELADYIFTLRQSGLADHHDEARRTLFTQIKNDHMAPLLQFVRDLLPDEYSDALYSELAQKNTEKLAELDEKIKDSEENLGEVELGQAAIAKAEYLAKICDKDKAITAYEDAFTKTSSLGARIDIVFSIIRLCLFFGDNELIKTNIARAQTLIDEGGDWDRRNRLKAHNGIYLLSIRQFEQSADQLLQVLATFTSLELTSYNQIACYAALAGAVALPRVDVKEKIIESPEVIEVLPSEDKYADVFAMITSLHTRDYAVFFTSLADVEEHHFRCNRYLAQHARWYVREMRRRAYAQILQVCVSRCACQNETYHITELSIAESRQDGGSIWSHV